jgi:hypothetical protein
LIPLKRTFPRRFVKVNDCPAYSGLFTPGFSHHAENLSSIYGKADIINGFEDLLFDIWKYFFRFFTSRIFCGMSDHILTGVLFGVPLHNVGVYPGAL